MPILSLLAKLGLDKTGFDAGMAAADKSVGRFGASLKAQFAGAFSAAAIVQFTKSIIDAGGQIKDLSERLGISVKDVQQFSIAARLGGQDSAAFASAIEKVRIAMVKGVKDGKNPLAQFGVTMADLRSGDAAGVLRKLAMELEGFAGSLGETQALAEVFGTRGFGNVVTILRQLREAEKEPIMTKEEVDLLDKAGDSMMTIGNRLRVIGAGMFMDLANPFHRFATKTPDTAPPTPISAETLEDPEAELKKVAEIEQQVTDQVEKNRVAQLTEEERLNELLAKRIELVRQLQFALTPEAVAKVRLQIAQTDANIITSQNRANAKPDVASQQHIAESAFGRIGAFTGAAAAAAVPQDQLRELREIKLTLAAKGIVVRDVKR